MNPKSFAELRDYLINNLNFNGWQVKILMSIGSLSKSLLIGTLMSIKSQDTDIVHKWTIKDVEYQMVGGKLMLYVRAQGDDILPNDVDFQRGSSASENRQFIFEVANLSPQFSFRPNVAPYIYDYTDETGKNYIVTLGE